jgi:hypothetical protein
MPSFKVTMSRRVRRVSSVEMRGTVYVTAETPEAARAAAEQQQDVTSFNDLNADIASEEDVEPMTVKVVEVSGMEALLASPMEDD